MKEAASQAVTMDERVLLHTPTGRDAELTRAVLADGNFHPEVCPTIPELCRKLREGAGAAVIAEEALQPPYIQQLVKTIGSQPQWSDAPLLILTSGGEATLKTWTVARALERLGNITLLERPVRVITLLSALHVALRARRRQYELRDYLVERERQEQALRQSENRYRILIEQAADGILLTDLRGRILDVNPALCQMLGYHPDELLGRHIATLVDPADLEQSPRFYEQREGESALSERRMLRKDGSVFVAETSGRVLDSNRAMAVIRDITARKRSELFLSAAHGVTRVLAQASNLQDATDRLPEVLRSGLEAEVAELWIVDPESGCLRLAGFSKSHSFLGYENFEAETRRHGFRPGEGLPGRVWASGTAAWMQNLYEEETFQRGRIAAEAGLQCGFAFPIHSGAPHLGDGEFFGVLACYFDRSLQVAEDMLGMVTSIGHEIGQFVQRERAEKALGDETRLLQTVNRINKSLAAKLDLDQLAQELTDAAREMLGAQFGAFIYHLINETGEPRTLYALSGAAPKTFEALPVTGDGSLFDRTFQGEGVIRINDLAAEAAGGMPVPFPALPDSHVPLRSYLAAPVVLRSGEVLGGLFFGHAHAGAFSERTERVIQGIADQAAIAVDNARLYQAAREEITSRKATEEALRESQERLRLAFAAGRMGTWTREFAGGVDRVYWSAELEDIYGFQPGEFLGTESAFMQQVLPEDRHSVQEAVRTAIENQSDYEVEFRFLPRGGGVRWMIGRGRAYYDGAGRPLRLAGVGIDVTERKRVEEALRESEEQYRASFELAGVGKAQFETGTGRFRRVNRKLCDIVGYGETELLELSYFQIIHPEDRAAVWRVYHEMLSGSRPAFTSENRYLRKDGAIAWVDSTVTVVRDSQGNPLSAISVFQDVTGRKRAEEALRESEARFRQLANAMPQMVWTADAQGRIEYFNERWFEYTGLPDQPRSIAEWHSRLHPGEADNYLEAYREKMESIEFFEWECRLRRWDGHYAWHLARAIPIVDVTGQVIRWIGTYTEIEDQKQTEKALQEAKEQLSGYADELERRVAERTAKLEETINSLESFCYSIAHDLRAPLRGMQGLTSALLEDYAPALDETGRDYAARVVASAKHMDQLIQDLLAYGRLSHQQMPATAVDLERETNTALDQLKDEIVRSGSAVEVRHPLAPVWGYPPVLQQILCNLVSNGIKFVCPNTTPLIKIWTEEFKNRVRLCVQDNGIGIDKAHHERIFRVFERLHGVDVYPGTGIGLAIVQKGVERMGGKIDVKSARGKGTCFRIQLPRPPATDSRGASSVER